jgi:hypothetical protein
MNPLCAFVLIAMLGSAVPPMATATTAPGTVLHIGFTDAAGDWMTPDWTNDWTFTALVSTDPAAPLAQWTQISPELEMYNGQLTFELDGGGPQLFCRGMFQPR